MDAHGDAALLASIDTLSRRDLQALCKTRGIKANSKSEILRAELHQWCAANQSGPAPSAAPSSTKSAKSKKTLPLAIDEGVGEDSSSRPSSTGPSQDSTPLPSPTASSAPAPPPPASGTSAPGSACFCVVHGQHAAALGAEPGLGWQQLQLRGGRIVLGAGGTPFVLSGSQAAPAGFEDNWVCPDCVETNTLSQRPDAFRARKEVPRTVVKQNPVFRFAPAQSSSLAKPPQLRLTPKEKQQNKAAAAPAQSRQQQQQINKKVAQLARRAINNKRRSQSISGLVPTVSTLSPMFVPPPMMDKRASVSASAGAADILVPSLPSSPAVRKARGELLHPGCLGSPKLPMRASNVAEEDRSLADRVSAILSMPDELEQWQLATKPSRQLLRSPPQLIADPAANPGYGYTSYGDEDYRL